MLRRVDSMHFFSVWHDSRPIIITIDNIYMMCGSRKYPYPTMEDIKISYGWGGDKCMSKTKKFQRGGEGVMLLLLTVVGCGYFLEPHNGLLSLGGEVGAAGSQGKMKERKRGSDFWNSLEPVIGKQNNGQKDQVHSQFKQESRATSSPAENHEIEWLFQGKPNRADQLLWSMIGWTLTVNNWALVGMIQNQCHSS